MFADRAHPAAGEPGPREPRVFAACALLSLVLQTHLVFARDGLWGGADLVPHLRLIQQVGERGLLGNTYAPAYHWLGALLAPWVGLALYPKLFAVAAAALLLAAFRSFQRAAALPDAAAALFCLTPYVLSLSWCTPRVEAAGYALLLFGLSRLLRRRYASLAALLAASFYVHTASALLFGIAAGILAAARRDGRGLAALAAGSLGALPLVAAHLAAGCTLPEAFLFSRGGYSRTLRESLIPSMWPWLLPLANPLAVGAAALGARLTWRADRPLALLAAALFLLYLNNLWLAPLGVRTLVTLQRGLSLLAIPVAMAAGHWVAARGRLGLGVVALSAAWAVLAADRVVPQACFVRRIELAELGPVSVRRCEFLWFGGRRYPPPPAEPRGGDG